jgi:hypothetical protein
VVQVKDVTGGKRCLIASTPVTSADLSRIVLVGVLSRLLLRNRRVFSPMFQTGRQVFKFHGSVAKYREIHKRVFIFCLISLTGIAKNIPQAGILVGNPQNGGSFQLLSSRRLLAFILHFHIYNYFKRVSS